MERTVFTIRSMLPDDIVHGTELSNAEGWNQTENDWRLLIQSPQNICLVAEYNEKIIGTTTAINYSNEIAWIGMVLVAKEYRGQGVSKSLLTNILKRLDRFRSIKLDATPEGQHVYKKFDFKDEYVITRMAIASMKNLSADDDVLPMPVQFEDADKISALDEFVFGANRAELIKWLIKEYPHKAWLILRSNEIVAFALGREGKKYHQVGPVFSSSINDAITLIGRALKELAGLHVVVDVPRDKEDLLHWLHSIGFARQRDFVRMYKRENPIPGIISKQYLTCGPEFG